MDPGAGRRAACWLGLLALAQVADVVTTALDLARGGVEAQPVTAHMLGLGGPPLLLLIKLVLVAALAIGLLLTLSRWRARGTARDRLAHAGMLWLTRLSVVLLSAVAANNAILLPSLGRP